jgi:hypothetical protein
MPRGSDTMSYAWLAYPLHAEQSLEQRKERDVEPIRHGVELAECATLLAGEAPQALAGACGALALTWAVQGLLSGGLSHRRNAITASATTINTATKAAVGQNRSGSTALSLFAATKQPVARGGHALQIFHVGRDYCRRRCFQNIYKALDALLVVVAFSL